MSRGQGQGSAWLPLHGGRAAPPPPTPPAPRPASPLLSRGCRTACPPPLWRSSGRGTEAGGPCGASVGPEMARVPAHGHAVAGNKGRKPRGTKTAVPLPRSVRLLATVRGGPPRGGVCAAFPAASSPARQPPRARARARPGPLPAPAALRLDFNTGGPLIPSGRPGQPIRQGTLEVGIMCGKEPLRSWRRLEGGSRAAKPLLPGLELGSPPRQQLPGGRAPPLAAHVPSPVPRRSSGACAPLFLPDRRADAPEPPGRRKGARRAGVSELQWSTPATGAHCLPSPDAPLRT
jgi:hypothetical protein